MIIVWLAMVCTFRHFWRRRMHVAHLELEDQVVWLPEHSESLVQSAAASAPQPGESAWQWQRHSSSNDCTLTASGPPRSQDMADGSGCGQVLVKARFPFRQTNEDELSFSKGDIISVSRQEDGGWWEGSLNGQTGWFPSNYVRELKGNGRCSSFFTPSQEKLFIALITTFREANYTKKTLLRLYFK